MSKRHHFIFGRRGSGKSSLLYKAELELKKTSNPIAYININTFKGSSYPDILLGILLDSFNKFKMYLEKKNRKKNLIESIKDRFFRKEEDVNILFKRINGEILKLEEERSTPDLTKTIETREFSTETSEGGELKGTIGVPKVGLEAKYSNNQDVSTKEKIEQAYTRSKIDFLNRQVIDYQNMFRQISKYTGRDSYLLLDDFYQMPRHDQPRILDYFHRIAEGNNLWLKIGTIRYRTNYYVPGDPSIGMKLGDDADEINLDATLVNYNSTKEFLRIILKRFLSECNHFSLEDILTSGAFDRLVLACGGVARDFLQIFKNSIRISKERSGISGTDKIGLEDINKAAVEYSHSKMDDFITDTSKDEQDPLRIQLEKIRSFCLNNNTNVFLINKKYKGIEVERINNLVDLRLLHIVKSHITVSKRVGKTYGVYLLDLSQYAQSRKRRAFDLKPFWDQDKIEDLRKVSYIFLN